MLVRDVGYLDELKRQADEARARQGVDAAGLERNTLTTDAACQSAMRYFTSLAQQLNVLQPFSKAVIRFDAQNEFRHLRLSDFRADSRLKKLRFADVFDHVVLNFEIRTGRSFSVAKDFPPTIEKLRARLAQSGAPFETEMVRDPSNGKFVETRFDVKADFRGSVRLVPDHDSAWVAFQITNLDGIATTHVSFPAIEVGSARLDELARWITGEPNRFLDGGSGLRVVEL